MRSILLPLLLLTGCATNPATPDAGSHSPDAAAGTAVSFQNDVVPLFQGCGGHECHGGGGMAPTVPSSAWPYATLVNIAAPECADGRDYVKPGDPTNSYLLQKLKGVEMCSGGQMPAIGTAFTDTQLQTISTWISQGALNN